mgnify:CR=1 FL=1
MEDKMTILCVSNSYEQKYYLNPEGVEIFDDEVATGIYYNGPTIAGVNVRYASDPEWTTKVFEIMKSLYNNL